MEIEYCICECMHVPSFPEKMDCSFLKFEGYIKPIKITFVSAVMFIDKVKSEGVVVTSCIHVFVIPQHFVETVAVTRHSLVGKLNCASCVWLGTQYTSD